MSRRFTRYTPEELTLVKDLRDKGFTQQQIADQIGVSVSNVNRRLEVLSDPARMAINERKKIPCITCRKPFLSNGPGNRMCTPCRQISINPYAL